jgi:hypothetical protein
MVRAVEKVRERLQRATAALEQASVPYAVIGGNAVAAWVTRIDEAAVRNTRDVDVLMRREDLARAIEALAAVGFSHRHVAGVDVFIDGSDGKVRDGVHVVFAREKVKPDYACAAPDVTQSESSGGFRVIQLEALVWMKLTSYRDKDRVHLRDLIDVGLVDATWTKRLPAPLAERLRHVLDTPDG